MVINIDYKGVRLITESDLEDYIDKVQVEIASLHAQLAEMQKPVTDEEWGQRIELEDQYLWRKGFDRILESRANPSRITGRVAAQQKGSVQ